MPIHVDNGKPEQIVADARLVFQNCIAFTQGNPHSVMYYQIAQKMLLYVEEQFSAASVVSISSGSGGIKRKQNSGSGGVGFAEPQPKRPQPQPAPAAAPPRQQKQREQAPAAPAAVSIPAAENFQPVAGAGSYAAMPREQRRRAVVRVTANRLLCGTDAHNILRFRSLFAHC